MFELNGKYNSCKVFTDNCDNETISQLTTLLNQESVNGSRIRIMPDTHAGKGSVIGTTMTLTNKVIPNLVGVDIGCGMICVKLKEKRIDLPKLDSVIRKYVPSGFEIHEEAICDASPIEDLRCTKYVNLDRAMKSLGTLGGGNHFIEVDKDSDDNLWLVVHTGSRHLGIEVCDYYQEMGYKRLSEKASGGSLKEKSDELIKKLKSEGRDKEISKSLEKLRAEYKASNISIPQALAYVEGQDFDDYLHDMDLVQQHAVINRVTIVHQIIKNMKFHVVDEFTTIHNYIDVDNMILRKGSVSAQLGEKLIIPMNMRDGSLICIGKGNPDWNYSAPHGAGRLMSRSQAKESISMSDFKKSMEGIYSTSVSRSTIDESPMVYKPMQEIIDNVKDTVDIVDIIKPIYNFKAGEESK
jgi:RNA-splicing ligase RtcB